jgi:hypothetical protein
MVKKPDPDRALWSDADRTLYELARRALADIPVKDWLFVVLNHRGGDPDNLRQCEILHDQLEHDGIFAAACEITNCIDPRETWTRVLDPALSYLAANIARLDQLSAAACEERLQILHGRLVPELQKAQQALGSQSVGDDPVFHRLFQDVWTRLTVGLEGLVRELDGRRDEPDTHLASQFNAIVLEARDPGLLPSHKQIDERRDDLGSYGQAFGRYLQELRTGLSGRFLHLEQSLRSSMDRIKRDVAVVLCRDAALNELSPAAADVLRSVQDDAPDDAATPIDPACGAIFLRELASMVPERLAILWGGLHVLSTFELSYRGFIQHRVRRHLDGLIQDTIPAEIIPLPPSAANVSYVLGLQYGEALAAIREDFESGDLFREPSQVAFSIVEEFVDHVLRSREAENNWREFYYLMRAQVWPDVFNALAAHSKMRVEWDSQVKRVADASQWAGLTLMGRTHATEGGRR